MALLGSAALAMWWEMDAGMRREFEDWHSHEHFPERLAIPGFRRGSRWASANGGDGFFVMYELADYEVLSSPAYLARLNAPTPWSTKMMPHHRNMVRCQCRVLESRGGVVAKHAVTIRLSPRDAGEEQMRTTLRALIASLAARPGFIGAHLLKHETPAIAETTEQRIRGGSDRMADWIFVACGHDLAAMETLAASELGLGVPLEIGLYSLSHSALPADVS